ncbi:MAG: hypothetical protein PHY14_03925 [Candidatus Gracilibacteria bacterium]|nr:hypothetical protein [Candidatus Gracilibacteria bacterium]
MRTTLSILVISSFFLTGCLQNNQPPTDVTPTPQESNSGVNMTNSGTTDTSSGKFAPEDTKEVEKEISIETRVTQSGSKEVDKAIDDSLKAIDNIMGN